MGVRQSALGSILGCAPGMRRALFWSSFPELAVEPQRKSYFMMILIYFTKVLQVFYWFWAKAIVDTWGVRRHMRRIYIYIYIYGVPLFFFRGVRRHMRRTYIYIYIYMYIYIYIYIYAKNLCFGDRGVRRHMRRIYIYIYMRLQHRFAIC